MLRYYISGVRYYFDEICMLYYIMLAVRSCGSWLLVFCYGFLWFLYFENSFCCEILQILDISKLFCLEILEILDLADLGS